MCNLMLKLHGISRSSATLRSDSPQSNNRKDNSLLVTPFIPRYCRLFKANTAYTSASTDARTALALWLSRGTRVCHWQSARKLWLDTRRLQLPLDDCCRLVLPYHAIIQHATDGTISLMTLPGWGQKVLLLAIIPVPRNLWYSTVHSKLAGNSPGIFT